MHRQSKWKHETKCKIEDNEKNCKIEDNEKDILMRKIEKLENNVENLMKIINDYCKIDPNTFQKINNDFNNSNININNGIINNDNKIINNNIKIIKFGSEKLSEILTEKEILNILNNRYLSLEESIKTIHFNKNRPEYQNICITNLKDDLAYVYNGTKFEVVSKVTMLNELIDIHTS